MMDVASKSMKKITYVRVNRAIQGKTVTVRTTKALTKVERKSLQKLFLTYRMCLNVLYTRKIAFYAFNTYQKVVNLTQRKTISPLTSHMARRTRLSRDQTLQMNCICMAKILKIQTAFHFTN